MNAAHDVTVYGETCLHVLTSARPSANVGMGQVELAVGGPAAVVAAQLALLGNRPKLVSQVGTDPEGRFVVEALERAGVDCTDVKKEGRTGRIVAGVEGGDVEIAADALAASGVIGPTGLPEPETGLTYVTGFPALVPVLKTLAKMGHRMVVDLGFIPLLSDPEALSAHIRDLAGAVETAVLSGARLSPKNRDVLRRQCFDSGASVVLTTLAADGVHVATAEAEDCFPAVPVDQVDPLCAGDAFVAGYLSRRLGGEDAFAAAQFGQRVAAAKVGMFARLPTPDDVLGLQS